MRIICFISILLFSLLSASHAQLSSNRTYYYERVAVVKNGNKQMASGDGHYLTINNRILYESDEKGLSKGTSSVKYINSDNDRPLYEGNTTLGQNLSYVFNSDFSRLNIKSLDGMVYVYERKSHSTPSQMRTYASQEGGTFSTPIVESVPSGSSSNRQTSSSPKRKQKETCSRCGGTKYIDKYIPSVSEYGVKKPEYYDCHICGKRVAKNGGHGHDTCPSCHGAGFVYK